MWPPWSWRGRERTCCWTICGWVIFWTTTPGLPSPFPSFRWGLSWLPTRSCACVPRNGHDCHKVVLPTMTATLFKHDTARYQDVVHHILTSLCQNRLIVIIIVLDLV